MHVRVKDEVVVMKGKDRGERGQVLSVDVASGRAVVAGRNMMKKHVRANPRQGVKGGILEQEAPIHVSNLMVVCPRCNEPTRVGHELLSGGGKVRCCKREGCGQQLTS